MYKLAQLSVRGAETDTSTTQISETQGTSWLTDVVYFAENLRYAEQVIRSVDFPAGKNTVTITKTTSALTVDFSPAGGEADVRDYTELSHLDTVSMTLASGDFYRGAIAISKQIVLTSEIDLISVARYAMSNGIAETVDDAIFTTLQGTSVTNVVYGGDATTVTELATGDVFSSDVIAKAKSKIETNNWVAKFMLVHSVCINDALLKESQFVNAAEYGDDTVLMNGEIGKAGGKHFGIRMIKTNNVPAFAAGASDVNELGLNWGAAGKCNVMIGEDRNGSRVSAAIAWKERPTVDYEYRKDRAIHVIYGDMTFDTAIIQASAICLMKVTNI